MKPLVYCIEHDPTIRELYGFALDSADITAQVFGTAEEFFDAVDKALPQAVIIDWMLPGVSGIEIISRLRSVERTRSLPCIMVSAKGDELSKVAGLNTGADDYLAKPFSVLELIARVKAQLRRAPAQSDILTCGKVRIDTETRKVFADAVELTLTVKEYQLLVSLMSRKNKICTRDDLLNEVWGYDGFIETRTLDMHIMTLRAKLLEAGVDDWVRTVRGIGYTVEE